MTRLNKTIREGIIKNAIDASGVTSRQDAVVIRRAKLADDVRLFAIGGVEVEKKLDAEFAKIKKQLDGLSSNYFQYMDYVQPRKGYDIDVNFSGRAIRLFFNGQETSSREFKFVRKNYIAHERVVIKSDNPLNDEFDSINKEQSIIDDLRVQVKSEVTAMINSVATVKKLLEIWPEAKDLLPEDEKVQSTALVADVQKLNTMIGLPKED